MKHTYIHTSYLMLLGVADRSIVSRGIVTNFLLSMFFKFFISGV